MPASPIGALRCLASRTGLPVAPGTAPEMTGVYTVTPHLKCWSRNRILLQLRLTARACGLPMKTGTRTRLQSLTGHAAAPASYCYPCQLFLLVCKPLTESCSSAVRCYDVTTPTLCKIVRCRLSGAEQHSDICVDQIYSERMHCAWRCLERPHESSLRRDTCHVMVSLCQSLSHRTGRPDIRCSQLV